MLVAWAAIGAPTPAEWVRPELDAALSRLSAVTRQASESKYLALVLAETPEFQHEQAYFAHELAKFPPKDVRFTLTDKPITADDASARGELRLDWTTAGGRERSVRFPARFVRTQVAGNPAWRYAGEAWQTAQAPGVIVMFDESLEATAKATAEAFAAIRPNVEASFGLAGTAFTGQVQRIKLYAAMTHLQASISLNYTDGLSGWNEPGESIKILPGQRASAGELKPLLAHEFGHVATFAMGVGSRSAPWWVLEGSAELAARPFQAGDPHADARRWAQQNDLAPFADLADFEHTSGRNKGRVYGQGRSMMVYINDHYGREARNAWLLSIGKGRDLDEASQEALGLTFDELDGAWRAMLRGDRAGADVPPAQPTK